MNDTFSRMDAESAQAVVYMKREIAHICKTFRPRAPGSEAEHRAAAYMAEALGRDCGCRHVAVEPFQVHPDAFYSYFYFSAALDCLGAFDFFVSPWIGLLFGSMALLLFLLQFVRYHQLIDPLFPQKESVNVTAIRPCSKEVRQRIFSNGHIDAAWEFPLNDRFGGIVFELPGVLALIGVCFYIVLSVFALCGTVTWTHTAGHFGLAFVPFFLLVAGTYNPKCVVDGANDDLSGCYIGIALLREMERFGAELEHTEVGVILTGSEEAGLRGAKAWGKAHQGEFQDVPTCILSFDTIHDPRYLMVNARDLNGTVRADKALGDVFFGAAAEAGVPCSKGQVPLFGGSTDSAAFTQAGFRSIGVTGLNHKLEDYYHTRRDSYDNLNDEGLDNGYRATLRLILQMEQDAVNL